MFSNLTFDEINDLNDTVKSEPYETYFGKMELSDAEREQRIRLAEQLENAFVGVLAYTFSMQQFDSVQWDDIRIRFENAYLVTLAGSIILNSKIQDYVRDFAQNVATSTREHEADLYYYTTDRAMFMAENEANTSLNYRQYYDAIESGRTMKRWVDIRDRRERETHRMVGGESIPIEDLFLVGTSLMAFPKDSTHGASGSEIVNCRCSIQYY